MRNRLIWKLLAVNLPIVAVVIAVIWAAIDFLAADYFMQLMKQYEISPSESHEMFVGAIHRYLIQVSLVAILVAAGLSLILTRRILRPLSDMAEVTQHLAAGDYGARVPVRAKDEVGELGAAFNEMAARLEQVEQLRKTMVADMAHELRTPLTNVRGYLEALADGVVPPSAQTFHMLQQEIMRLVRLVEDLNRLTKADAAAMALRREPVALPQLVGQALELYGYRFNGKQVTVETRIDDAAARVTGDPDKLLQVVCNLLQNAWQYTPQGGRVRVTAARGAEEIRLTVANTGAGIAEVDLPHVFERFYRADKSRSRDSGGAGIGLAIVKALIEPHGGKVGASSGDGETRIWFTLPA